MGTSLVDDLLRQYVECTDEERAESLLGELVVEHAQPGIRKVVRYKLAFQGQGESQDVEDVASDVMVELIARLRGMRNGAAADGIGSFAGYTAVAAYHACHEYLRRKYPNRHRLKTRLRYLLNTEKPVRDLGESGGHWLCGFQKWQDGGTRPAPADAVGRWRDTLQRSAARPERDAPRRPLGPGVRAILTARWSSMNWWAWSPTFGEWTTRRRHPKSARAKCSLATPTRRTAWNCSAG